MKALANQLVADFARMAFSHHELSVENAVIPFSLSLPSHSQAGPATFEMEFPPDEHPGQNCPQIPRQHFPRL
ncbi:hypothetical protein C4E44_03475 [Pseudomonas sp. MWU12-2312b]|nr:hypothetical protein C4E44_03475 [Pseudomonas sp. MWU12-2312b]